MIPLLTFGLVLVAFYVLILRPQRRQVLAHRALVASLQVGDEIITSGGVYGTIKSMDEAVLQVEFADGVIVRVARSAVASKVVDPNDPTGEATGEDVAPNADGTSD